MVAALYLAVLALLSAWALFWIIRLAVRYGVNDAIRMNRSLWRGSQPAHHQPEDG